MLHASIKFCSNKVPTKDFETIASTQFPISHHMLDNQQFLIGLSIYKLHKMLILSSIYYPVEKEIQLLLLKFQIYQYLTKHKPDKMKAFDVSKSVIRLRLWQHHSKCAIIEVVLYSQIHVSAAFDGNSTQYQQRGHDYDLLQSLIFYL